MGHDLDLALNPSDVHLLDGAGNESLQLLDPPSGNPSPRTITLPVRLEAIALITLNSDLGESFGLHSFGNDDALLSVIDTANVACGLHAGDPSVMAATVEKAAQASVAVGAHPGLPDLVGFGRREMALTPAEVRHLVLY